MHNDSKYFKLDDAFLLLPTSSFSKVMQKQQATMVTFAVTTRKGVPSTQGLDTKKICVEVLSFRSIFELRNTILICVRVVSL